MVGVAHRQCRQDEWMGKQQWRLSFSRAEVVLINSWIPVQQIVYHMLRVFMKAKKVTESDDKTGTKILSNYHIKTLMLWACELKPRSWWTGDLNLIRTCVELMRTLTVRLSEARCQHYFIHDCNLLDHVDNSLSASPLIVVGEFMSTTETSLCDWFINCYIRQCAQLCPQHIARLFDDVTTSTRLQNTLAAVVDWRLNYLPFLFFFRVYTRSVTNRECGVSLLSDCTVVFVFDKRYVGDSRRCARLLCSVCISTRCRRYVFSLILYAVVTLHDTAVCCL